MPYPRSPGYGNPRKDTRGYWAVTVAPGKPTDQPISVTKEEIQRELRQHPDRKYGTGPARLGDRIAFLGAEIPTFCFTLKYTFRHVTIRWTFDCKQPQIQFSVLFMKGFNAKYKEDGTPLTTLVAPEDVDAQSKPVRHGTWTANAVGAKFSTRARAYYDVYVALQVTGHIHAHQPGTYILRWENVVSKKPVNLNYQVHE